MLALHYVNRRAGKILTDAQTVAEYNIKETDFLVVMPGKVCCCTYLYRYSFHLQPRVAAVPTPAKPVRGMSGDKSCEHVTGCRAGCRARHARDTCRCTRANTGVCMQIN